jgi:hypothetical protein
MHDLDHFASLCCAVTFCGAWEFALSSPAACLSVSNMTPTGTELNGMVNGYYVQRRGVVPQGTRHTLCVIEWLSGQTMILPDG